MGCTFGRKLRLGLEITKIQKRVRFYEEIFWRVGFYDLADG